jgi:hypothetical protein
MLFSLAFCDSVFLGDLVFDAISNCVLGSSRSIALTIRVGDYNPTIGLFLGTMMSGFFLMKDYVSEGRK